MSRHPLAQINRAAVALNSITRLVGNSIQEPDLSGADPLDAHTTTALMDGAQCLSQYVLYMVETTHRAAQDQRKPGGS